MTKVEGVPHKITKIHTTSQCVFFRDFVITNSTKSLAKLGTSLVIKSINTDNKTMLKEELDDGLPPKWSSFETTEFSVLCTVVGRLETYWGASSHVLK